MALETDENEMVSLHQLGKMVSRQGREDQSQRSKG